MSLLYEMFNFIAFLQDSRFKQLNCWTIKYPNHRISNHKIVNHFPTKLQQYISAHNSKLLTTFRKQKNDPLKSRLAMKRAQSLLFWLFTPNIALICIKIRCHNFLRAHNSRLLQEQKKSQQFRILLPLFTLPTLPKRIRPRHDIDFGEISLSLI